MSESRNPGKAVQPFPTISLMPNFLSIELCLILSFAMTFVLRQMIWLLRFSLLHPHCARLSAPPARFALDCAEYVACQNIVCGTFHHPAQSTRTGEIPGI